jgi:pyruvate dehydrogenase E1 component beta subunit
VVASVHRTSIRRCCAAPVARVAVPDVPIPYAHGLEYAVLPRHDRIEAAIRAVAAA